MTTPTTNEMNDWNKAIIAEFRANAGKVGGRFEGASMILLHHIGAKSGIERTSPLVYFPQDDGTIVIIASKGGAPTNPDWYHNLKANPKFDVEVGAERFAVVAEELDDAERAALWPALVAAAPGFAEYQKNTSRKIPVLRLTRAA